MRNSKFYIILKLFSLIFFICIINLYFKKGVVTRVPLELRLVRKSDAKIPYEVFYHPKFKNEKYQDFGVVKQKILELTDLLAGVKKEIVDNPIKLTVTSSYCPDLTLIDLPGITRIPLEGSNQGKDIEQVTKKLCAHYCSDNSTIILCVIPANADLTTSDALKMALELDAEKDRTIGVLTKIDIMDQGTSAKDILTGKIVSLKLGFFGVKNRSQFDLNNKMRVEQALEKGMTNF